MNYERRLRNRIHLGRLASSASGLGLCFILAIAAASCTGDQGRGEKDSAGHNAVDRGLIERVVDLTPVLAAADSILRVAVDEELVAGAVLSIGLNGTTIHEKAFGYAQSYEYGLEPMANPLEMTTETVFDLASLTKVFATTFGMMLLVDQNRVDLDAPVSTYLPAFSGAGKDSVTVRHLLTHTAGLYSWKPLYYHADNKRDTYAYISGLELAYPVGQARHYSDLGFMLLGYLIEEVSGKPLEQFLADELYEPLGLQTTGYLPQTRGITGFAATSHGNPFEHKMVADDDFGYVCDEDAESFQGWRRRVLFGEVNDGNAYYANEGVAGHAGLFSTAADLQVLFDLLMKKGLHDGERYLSEEVVDQFLTKNEFDNGLGWAMSSRVLPVDNLPVGAFGHTGFTGTFALAVPESKLTVILLTNRQNVGVDSTGRYNSVTPLRRQVSGLLIDAIR